MTEKQSRLAASRGSRRRRLLAAVVIVGSAALFPALVPVLAGTGPGEFFLDVAGLRALEATLDDSTHRADLRARGRVLALRSIWGGLEPDPTERCTPFGETPGAPPEQYRLHFDFAPIQTRSARVYRAAYTCCRLGAESYLSVLSSSGFRSGSTESPPVCRDAEAIDVLDAALEQEITRVPLYELAAGDEGIRHLEITRTECVPGATTLGYQLFAAPRPLAKWSADTPIVAFSVTYDTVSGEILFEEIASGAARAQRDG